MYSDRNIISGKLFNIPKIFVGILVLVVALGMVNSSFAESQTNSHENDFAGKECHNGQIQSGNHCDQNNCSKETEKSGNKCGYGAIHGQKYNDLNRNGAHDEGEPFLNGWTIFFDENNNETFDKGEKYRITHDDPRGNPGHYWFTKLPKDNYTVCEVLKTKWVQTQPGTPEDPQCYNVTLESSGQRFEDLDFGNHYPVPNGIKLTVIKKVINDNGGTAVPSDFTMQIYANNPTKNNFPGSVSGTTLEIGAGPFSVTESGPNGYIGTFSGCSGTANKGDHLTCTITNDDNVNGTLLTVTKKVNNENGGIAKAEDFIITIFANNPTKNNFPGSVSGTTLEIDPGPFSVTESGPNGYIGTFSGCSGTANKGDHIKCTITNNYDPTDQAGHNQWDTRPTFGISHETRETTMVQHGFSFNYKFYNVTDNHHTPFEELPVKVGSTNSFMAKVYADKKLKIQEFLFGIPGVGMGHLAELRVEVWYILNEKTGEIKIDDVKIIQNSDVIDPLSLQFSHKKSDCLKNDNEKKCDSTTIYVKFLEPLQNKISAIKATDFERRSQTTYLNDGFDIAGKSLNPMNFKMIPSTIKGEGLIKVTQNEKYSNYWSTEDGRIFEMNSFGSFKQINPSFDRFQDSGNAFSRLHSNFEKIISYEKLRALQIFNSTQIQSKLPESFAYVFPEYGERITEEVIQEMITQENIAERVFDSLHKQHRWN